jgi:hypothetical protein
MMPLPESLPQSKFKTNSSDWAVLNCSSKNRLENDFMAYMLRRCCRTIASLLASSEGNTRRSAREGNLEALRLGATAAAYVGAETVSLK